MEYSIRIDTIEFRWLITYFAESNVAIFYCVPIPNEGLSGRVLDLRSSNTCLRLTGDTVFSVVPLS